MMLFWIVCSIAFIVMLILTIKKRRKKQKYKIFAIITSILFIIGLFTFIGIASSPAVDENDNSSEESTSSKKESSDLDNKVDSVILDTNLNDDKDVSNLLEEGKLTKSEAQKITTKISDKSDEVKKKIKKDKKYSDLEKKYENGEASDNEVSDFMQPYLREIDNVLLDNLSK
ncbi:hypothetical protein [Staphylococcus pasteuri]|uniref:hypothetical protein n=1 Tax=Staphylococcus pasteuri TaxID=45972 RepID=UPI0012B90662|nr:hypothetical protein [Staphylococcus pasteuri]